MHFKEVTSKYASLHNIAQRKMPTSLIVKYIYIQEHKFFSTYYFASILSLFLSILNSIIQRYAYNH